MYLRVAIIKSSVFIKTNHIGEPNERGSATKQKKSKVSQNFCPQLSSGVIVAKILIEKKVLVISRI